MSKRTVDAVVLGTSLFAAVALLGAAVTAFDANRPQAQARVGSSPPLAASSLASAPALEADEVAQALTPFVPVGGAADPHDHAAMAPLLASGDHVDGHEHGTTDMAADHMHEAGTEHADDHSAAGHGHGTPTPATVIADGDDWEGGPFEGWRIQWEPAQENHGSALRVVDMNDVAHVYSPSDAQCGGVAPTQTDLDYGTWLVARTHETLQRYRNRPDLAIADGYVPYPLGNRYWHMINLERLGTNEYQASADPAVGNPNTAVLNPDALESFIYGLVDGAGLVPLGGMYMYGEKDAVPPAPFGCVTSWHMHTGSQGFITSFDLSDPRSVWMVHVWDLPMISSWGEYDGTYSSDWWVGWRYIPSVCTADDCPV